MDFDNPGGNGKNLFANSNLRQDPRPRKHTMTIDNGNCHNLIPVRNHFPRLLGGNICQTWYNADSRPSWRLSLYTGPVRIPLPVPWPKEAPSMQPEPAGRRRPMLKCTATAGRDRQSHRIKVRILPVVPLPS